MAIYHESLGYTTPDEVRSKMLVEWSGYKPATVLFNTDIEPQYHTAFYADDLDIHDDSFSRQMWQLFDDPSSVNPKITTRPEAFVVTADSAIPVAASIRGFYETFGKPTPHLTYINADRNVARNYFERNILDDTEVDRLTRELSNAKHVTVVDQFIHSGSTIACAAHLLRHAGIELVSGMRGRWYAHCNPDHVDRTSVTSQLDVFMKSIGHMAAQRTYCEQ